MTYQSTGGLSQLLALQNASVEQIVDPATQEVVNQVQSPYSTPLHNYLTKGVTQEQVGNYFPDEQLQQQLDADRNFGQGIQDLAVSAAAAAANTGVGLGQAAASFFSPDLAKTLYDTTQTIQKSKEYFTSSIGNVINKANQQVNTIQDQASEKRHQEANTILDSLTQFGQDFTRGITRTFNNPTDAAGQTIGTLAPAILGGGLGRLVGGNVGSTLGLASLSVSDASNSTYNEIINQKPEELAKTVLGQEKIAQGVSLEDLPEVLASEVANRAALLSIPGSVITSAFGDKLAKNPTGFTLGQLRTEVLSEMGDEINSQVSSNIAQKTLIDPNKALLAGVGQNTGQAAINTLGLGGGVGSVNTILNLPDNILKTLDKQLDDKSPVGEKAINKINDYIVGSNIELKDTINQLEAKPDKTEQDNNVLNVAKSLDQKVNDTFFEPITNLPDTVQKYASVTDNGTVDTINTLKNIVVGINKGTITDQQEINDNALYLINKVNELNKEENSPQTLLENNQNLSSDSPLINQLNGYNKVIKVLNTFIDSNENLNKIKQSLDFIEPEDGNYLNQEVIKNIIDIGQNNPEAIISKPTVMDTIIKLRDSANNDAGKLLNTTLGDLLNSPILDVLATLSKESKAINNTVEPIKINDIGDVKIDNKPIISDKTKTVSENVGTTSNGFKRSLTEFASNILSGINTGTVITSTGRKNSVEGEFKDLQKFTKHLLNKANATTQSIAKDGEAVPYKALNAKTRGFFDTKVEYSDLNSNSTKGLIAATYSNAISAINLHNRFIESFSNKFGSNKKLPLPNIPQEYIQAVNDYRTNNKIDYNQITNKTNNVDTSSKEIKVVDKQQKEVTTNEQKSKKDSSNRQLEAQTTNVTQQSNENVIINNQEDTDDGIIKSSPEAKTKNDLLLKRKLFNLEEKPLDIKGFNTAKDLLLSFNRNDLTTEQQAVVDYLLNSPLIKGVDTFDLSEPDAREYVYNLGDNLGGPQIVETIEVSPSNHERGSYGIFTIYGYDNRRGIFFDKRSVINNEKIFIEIVLHELLHSITSPQVEDYYYNEGRSLTENQKKAIQNMEELAFELKTFVDKDTTDLSKVPLRVQDILKGIISLPLSGTPSIINKHAVVVEMFTYPLTSPEMSKFVQKLSITDKLYNLMESLYNNIRDFFGFPKDTNKSVYENIFKHTKIVAEESVNSIFGKEPTEKQLESVLTEKISKDNIDNKTNTDVSITTKNTQITNTLYNSLYKEKGKSLFLSGFKINKDHPTATNIINTLRDVKELSKNILINYIVDPNKVDKILGFTASMYNGFNDYFDKLLSSTMVNKKENLSLLDAMNLGKDLTQYPRYKLLSLLDQDSNKINQDLLGKASLAFTDWVLNLNPGKNSNNTEDLKTQYTYSRAKEDLARNIEKFWGVKQNNKESMSNNRGISESLAAEMLEYYLNRNSNNKLFTSVLVDIISDNENASGFEQTRVLKFNNQLLDQFKNILGIHTNILSDVIGDSENKKYSIGTPIKDIKLTQANSSNELTNENKKTIKNANNIAYYINSRFTDFINRLGKDVTNRLLGYVNLEDKSRKYHISHQASIEGKNLSLNRNWDIVNNLVKDVTEYSDNNNVSFEDVPTYYNHTISKVLRLQQADGGPQSNKLMREVNKPNRSTLTLSNKEDMDKFWLSVAQGSGLIKIEKFTKEDSVNMIQEKFFEEFQPQLDYLKEAFDTNYFNPEEFYQTFIDNKTLNGEPLTEVQLHTILAVYFHLYDKENNLEKVKHNLSVEFDGKTNGLMNFIQSFTTGAFTESFLTNVAKAGFFIGSNIKTLGEYVSKYDPQDMYDAATIKFANELVDAHNKAIKLFAFKDKDKKSFIDDIYKFIDVFGNLDFTVDDETNNVVFKANRNTIKNPITKFIYGAGINSTVEDVVNELIDNYYKEISLYLNGESTLFKSDEDVKNYIGNLVKYDFVFDLQDKTTKLKESHITNIDNLFTYKGDKSIQNMVVSKQTFHRLVSTMKTLYGIPLDKAMKAQVGNVNETFSSIQAITEAQSIVAMDIFNKRLDTLLKQRREEGVIGNQEFLSKEDYMNIFNDIRPLMPNYNTHLGNMTFSGSERTKDVGIDGKGYNLSQSLSGKGKTKATFVAPTLAGVKSKPYINIGMGDGSMIQIFLNENPIEDNNVLLVFDGVEAGLNNLEDNSKRVNKAVYESWKINKITPLINSFRAFKDTLNNISNNNPESVLDAATIKSLEYTYSTFSNQYGVKSPYKTLNELFNEYEQFLLEKRDDIQARINTIDKVGFSVDQMAGASSPYTKDGFTSDNIDERLDTLNKIYQEELAKIKAKNIKIDPITNIEKSDPKIIEDIKSLLSPDQNEYVLSGNQVSHLLLGNEDLSLEQKRLVRDLLPAIDSNTLFVFNNPELNNIESIKNKYFSTMKIDLSNPNINGTMATDGSVVFIKNISGETLLHELVHLVTIQKVSNYYNDSNLVSDTDKTSIKVLEVLMNKFLKTDFKDNTLSVDNLKNVIRSSLDEDSIFGKVKALNEFMAWTLTNKDLIQKTRNTRVVLSDKLKDLFTKAFERIKSLFRLKKDTYHRDFYNNILFNTLSLIEPVDNITGFSSAVRFLNQETVVPKLNVLNQKVRDFINRIDTFSDNNTIKNKVISDHILNQRLQSLKEVNTALQTVLANNIDLNEQQQQTYKSIFSLFTGEFKLNSNAYINLQNIYTKVLDKLDNDKYSFLDQNSDGNQNLANFLALSQVSPEFQKELSSIRLDKKDVKFTSLDQYLEDTTSNIINNMSSSLYDGTNTKESLDSILSNLIDVEVESSNSLLNNLQNKLPNVDNYISDKIQKFGESLQDRYKGKKLEFVGQLLDKDKVDYALDTSLNLLNQFEGVPLMVKELFKELIGKTVSSKNIEDLLNKVKYAVSKTRQDYKNELPKIFNSKFNTKPTSEVWSLLHKTLGKTDLFSFGSVEDNLNLIKSDKTINDRIYQLESDLQKLEPKRYTAMINKSKQLANYMNTKNYGKNLLSNAYAIAKLLNESQQNTQNQEEPSDTLVNTIDELTSLYSFNSLNKSDKKSLRDLLKTEYDGISFIAGYIKELNNSEKAKLTTKLAKNNYYKGNLPLDISTNSHLIIANDLNHNKLAEVGYIRIADYTGSSARTDNVKYGYYYSNVVGSPYEQGILQTVQTTVGGIDPITGKTVNGNTAGHIYGSDVDYINRRIKSSKTTTNEEYSPIFGEDDTLIGFERTFNPEVFAKVKQNTQLDKIIGIMRGRQAEELFAKEFNKMLIDKTYDLYKEQGNRVLDKNIFINIAQSKDKIHQENWKLIPQEMKEYIQSKFGDNTFYVRADLINNTLGYRLPSVKDVFTYKTRFNNEVANGIKVFSKLMLGNNAFKYLGFTEKALQTLVQYGKNIIVVKSIIVPLSSIASNYLQMVIRGIPNKTIYTQGKIAFNELNTFIKNDKRKIAIEAELFSITDPNKKIKLTNELKSINAINDKMSIAPLIKAGEFNTISEGLADIDLSLSDNRLGDWIEQQVNKLPQSIKTTAKYAIVSKDTALYKGLARALQYGDFIAKSIYYTDMINKGISEVDALNRISEEYVNYNYLPGRSRSYLESIGLINFFPYKIRILKTAVSMIRNNPFRALMSNFMIGYLPDDLGLGTPIVDNILSQTVSGRLDHSLGLGMTLQAHNLNPWLNITN